MQPRKKKVLFAITKLELGGAQKHLLALVSQLDRNLFDIYVYTASEGLLIEDFLLIQDITFWKSRWLQRPIHPLKDLAAIIELYLLIKKNKISLVHTHSSKAGIVGRIAAGLAGVPNILHTLHGWSFHPDQPWLLRQFYIALERFCAAWTKCLIVVSIHDRDKGIKNRIGNQAKYRLIRYGIPLNIPCSAKSATKDRLGIKEDTLVVTMVACFKPQKSPQSFVKLARMVVSSVPHKVKFFLVGDGILRLQVERLLKNYSLENHFILLGWRRDIFNILSVTDIFVLTSLWEGMPMVALEAMAQGLPIVVTNTGGIAELIRDGENGYLVEPQDIQDMSLRVTTLLKDEALRKSMGMQAKSSISEEFSQGYMVSSIEKLYQSLMQ